MALVFGRSGAVPTAANPANSARDLTWGTDTDELAMAWVAARSTASQDAESNEVVEEVVAGLAEAGVEDLEDPVIAPPSWMLTAVADLVLQDSPASPVVE